MSKPAASTALLASILGQTSPAKLRLVWWPNSFKSAIAGAVPRPNRLDLRSKVIRRRSHARISRYRPRELRLPPSRRQGSDPAKLQRQISLFGRSALGMPSPWVYEAADGVLVVYNGVTRATRIAKLSPGLQIRVEIIGTLPRNCASLPTIGDMLP